MIGCTGSITITCAGQSESITRAVLDKAEGMHADPIVLGHTGKNAIDRFLLGSVSNRVVHHAPCSTWTVR